MSHQIRADPEKLRRMADLELDSSKEMTVQLDYLAAAIQVFARAPRPFGNLAWSDQFGTETRAAADDTGAAIGALGGALARDVQALSRTAANYEKLDEGLTEDDFGRPWHELKEFGKDFWRMWGPGD